MKKLAALDVLPRVKELRAQGMGLLEAKRQAERERILTAVDEARNFYELRALVRTIAERVL